MSVVTCCISTKTTTSNVFENYQKIKHIFGKKINILDFFRIKVVILFVLEQMFGERFQMSAQIIEFPMNRVRPAQQAIRPTAARTSRARTAPAVTYVSRPVAIARAILGWALILIIAVALLLGVGKQIQSAQATGTEVSASEVVKFEYVTIMSGDSLWGLAEQYAPERDPRDFIADIVALNNLSDSVVDAGMTLALPIN
jgi:LysM repeat protein